MNYFSDLALEAEKILLSNKNLDILGELLHESWEMKKKLVTKFLMAKSMNIIVLQKNLEHWEVKF